jgi:clan AA aspartic protease (TIGR02281 family)
MRLDLLVVCAVCGVALSGCTFLEASGDAVGVVGKVAWTGTKAIGSAVYTGTSMAGQTANQANKTVSSPSKRTDRPTKVMLSGERTVVPLIKEGKSFYVRVKLNDKLWGRFLVDTGASALQISGAMAKKLKLRAEKEQTNPVMLAGGAMVAGRLVVLSSVRIGDASVENVRAIVLQGDNNGFRDGLLGMTFLENFVFQIDTKRNELILNKR